MGACECEIEVCELVSVILLLLLLLLLVDPSSSRNTTFISNVYVCHL